MRFLHPLSIPYLEVPDVTQCCWGNWVYRCCVRCLAFYWADLEKNGSVGLQGFVFLRSKNIPTDPLGTYPQTLNYLFMKEISSYLYFGVPGVVGWRKFQSHVKFFFVCHFDIISFRCDFLLWHFMVETPRNLTIRHWKWAFWPQKVRQTSSNYHYLVVEPTHLKNMSQNGFIFPR